MAGQRAWWSGNWTEVSLPVTGTILAPNSRLPRVKPAALAQRRPMPRVEEPATSLVLAISIIMAKIPKNVWQLKAPYTTERKTANTFCRQRTSSEEMKVSTGSRKGFRKQWLAEHVHKHPAAISSQSAGAPV